ncbi:MAG: outer membrane beta-barrel protein [Myxococcota bacterium]
MSLLARWLAAALLVVGFGAQIARADDEAAPAPDLGFGRSGAYIGVGASRSINYLESYLDSQPLLTNIQFGNSWGVNARVGYRVFSWLALEGEYEWLDDFTARLDSIEIARIGAQSATANFRLIAPLGRFQPYFLGGVGALIADSHGSLGFTVEHSTFAGRVGLGIDVYLTPHVLLNVGAEAILSDAQSSFNTALGSVSANGIAFLTLQAGLGYRF